MYYLKYGRFSKGISKKQIKRISRLADNYILEDEKLLFVKDKERILEIPKPEDRKGIIERAHALGHFQTESTYNSIKEKFYWKRMIDQIRRVIKQCISCQRNNKMIVKYHPALVTVIKKLFDRISIDLVFGLTITAEGYIGILVIVEFLSKYPWAKAIKSKTAKEIAKHLFEYITIFGPFKDLLSDQGKEFCNQIMEELKKSVGFNHITTSAYNPRTNGITERFNQTLVESLRKHSEANVENWPEQLNYVLLAYRTRVHSVTNYTPFELMFGRKMNGFEDWSSNNEDEIVAIINRTNEIRILFEETHNRAVDNITKGQVRQKAIQNKAQNVEEEKIAIGKTVYLKCEGLLTKLEPRFKGPYTITGHTSRGNYKVNNALGEALPESFPRHKIKVVEDNDDLPSDSLEIEKIISHKIIDNEWLYLVKWKELPRNESTWIPEKNFNTLDIVNNYKKSISNRRELRPRKSKKLNYITSIALLVLITFMPTIFCAPTRYNTTKVFKGLTSKSSYRQTTITRSKPSYEETILINGDFKVCSASLNKNLINLNTMCNEKPNQTTSVLRDYVNDHRLPVTNKNVMGLPMYIFGKIQHEVYGHGIHCMMKKHVMKTSTNIIGVTYESFRTENAELSYDDCYQLNKTRKCKGNNMECDGDYCSYTSNPQPIFKWFSDVTTVTYSCTLSRKLITAKTIHDHVFNLNCLAADKQCKMHDSIVVWDDSAFHKCPLYLISQEKFEIHLGSNNPDILLSYPKLAFQVTKQERLCNMQVMSTTEGVYLGIGTNKEVNKKSIEGADINEIKELLLADIDYESHSHAVDRSFLIHQECLNLRSILKSFAMSTENEFLTHILPNGNNITVYSFMKNVYIGTCRDINSVIVIGNTQIPQTNPPTCYEYQPVIYNNNKFNKTGFLTPDGVIQENSKAYHCNVISQFIQIPGTDMVIARRNEKSVVIAEKHVSYIEINYLSNTKMNENFTHNHILSETVDILFTMQEIMNEEINSGTVYNPPNENKNININSKFLETRKEFENIIQNLKNKFIYFLAILGAIKLIVFIILIIIQVVKLIIKWRLARSKFSKYNSSASLSGMEMNNLINDNNIDNKSNLKKSISLSSLAKSFLK